MKGGLGDESPFFSSLNDLPRFAAETANRHRSSNAGGYKMPQEIDFTGASPG
jgi:hypothetical protein